MPFRITLTIRLLDSMIMYAVLPVLGRKEGAWGLHVNPSHAWFWMQSFPYTRSGQIRRSEKHLRTETGLALGYGKLCKGCRLAIVAVCNKCSRGSPLDALPVCPPNDTFHSSYNPGGIPRPVCRLLARRVLCSCPNTLHVARRDAGLNLQTIAVFHRIVIRTSY